MSVTGNPVVEISGDKSDFHNGSLKLAGELGDHVSVGWAHGNLGNAMLGLDQKDKVLDHLITALHMSARYRFSVVITSSVSLMANLPYTCSWD